MSGDYEIRRFEPDMLEGALDCLSVLWGDDRAANRSYFTWKYMDNPVTQELHVWVALANERVVGIRGFFATPWHTSQQNKHIILSPCDTCVTPDHRRKNLSLVIAEQAMKVYEPEYRILLNTTAGKTAVRGYLKLGFKPLVNKTYLAKYRLSSVLWTKFRPRSGPPKETTNYGDIEVSRSSSVGAMANVVAHRDRHENTFSLVRDSGFLGWRYANPKGRYIFYYGRRGGDISGYVVIMIEPGTRYGIIVDYEEITGTDTIERILRLSLKKHFTVLMVPAYSVSPDAESAFSKLGFRSDRLLLKRRQAGTGILPLLVRPVRKGFSEQDWLTAGKDIREIRNWRIPGIASDGY